ncbi:hypothetical protein Pmar_PMAR012390 [Perkinsus marinus ATCC 50983]|uniref:Uncharacterized protein n=1 Tax=Perkinsus marinus (strain ATCC 50983 / TXsc) TaxID=423536 RepID=C5K777_PERM5|nr:hypothetical protein Pmar_PMAR012390 [Perkinsus marinus ATCC 50983]EER19412.1 hypothetical protein Pmar_PMAR012390 [Perkinsus marinus ATCC 50983]|eukprot:XP_002787616.1 hypothetical protein Pmar_PMAR012390 [Perkinsus marinus ATCC 50983]
MFVSSPQHETSMTRADLITVEKVDRKERKDRVGDDTQSDWSDETPYESDQESSVAIVGESASFEDMSAFYNRVDALRQRFLRLLNAVQLPTQAVKILKDLMGTVQLLHRRLRFEGPHGDCAGDPNTQVFDAAGSNKMAEVPNIKASLPGLIVHEEKLTKLIGIPTADTMIWSSRFAGPTVLACPGTSIWQLLGVICSDPLTQGFQHVRLPNNGMIVFSPGRLQDEDSKVGFPQIRDDLVDAIKSDAEVSKALLLTVQCKLSFYATNHDVGQGTWSGALSKFFKTYFDEVITYDTPVAGAVHAFARTVDTRRTITWMFGSKNNKNATVVWRPGLGVDITADVALGLSANPAGHVNAPAQ